MGSLTSASFGRLALGAPFILIGTGLLLVLSWRLNLLPLSEDEARSSGVNLTLLRGLTAFSATMITASAVSMCGQVGWVGLLVPHVCRLALGSDNRRLIPASISLGAAFLVVIDTAARSLTPSEIPISVLTAIIGAPFFIALLRKNGGWEL
ncbi:Iron-uptake system permease protein FeuB [bioreactor metagenome]|uniref:Iron-uptake system permease protein FeuB n=1 Tax=bioreactor metagenome TaxID=1076179 RepID=A0A645BWT7_9ZZZZ